MKGSRAILEARLVLCDATVAHPERSGVPNLFLRELLRAVAENEARRIRRELKWRDERRRP